MNRRTFYAGRLLVPAAVMFCFATSAYADDASGDDASSGFTNEWHGNIGAGVMVAPSYPGASDKKTKAVPVFGASYNRFFVGAFDGAPTVPFSVGALLYKDEHWKAGVALSYDIFSPRKESDDSSKLHGMGDVDRTAHATLFASYTKDWLSANLAVSSDIAGKHQGTKIRLGVDGKYAITSKLMFSAGPSITWSSAQANQTFYGVDAEQSALSGYARYTPSSGISDVSFGVGVNYVITKRWNVGARASISYLPSDVSSSPIVGSRTPVSFGIFAGYHF